MIVGFNLNLVSARVDEEKLATRGVTVNSVPAIVSMEKADVLNMKDVLRVRFTFNAKYEPEVGDISMEGGLLWHDDGAKKVLKMWEDDKKIEPKAGVEIMNTIFRKCLAKAVTLADDVRLPPPVQFPVVTEKKEKQEE